MDYEYVNGLLNINTSMSSAMSLWKHRPTGQYYISRDGLRDITPVTNNQYMLLYEEPKPMYSKYRDRLTNPKLSFSKRIRKWTCRIQQFHLEIK